MPETLPLEVTPSPQQFQILLDGIRHTLEVRPVSDALILVSVWRSDGSGQDKPVVSCVRAGSRTPILPYHYLEGGAGNFWFETPNDEIPTYTEFGARHQLMYATAAEIAEARTNA